MNRIIGENVSFAALLLVGCAGVDRADDPSPSEHVEERGSGTQGIQGSGRQLSTQGIEGTGRHVSARGIQGTGRTISVAAIQSTGRTAAVGVTAGEGGGATDDE
jgi:hypothetical protein